MIYGPYRTHASRGTWAGTKPTPWDDKERGHRSGARPRRFTVKALEAALRDWVRKLKR